MHGAIFKQFKDFVAATLGAGAWDDLRDQAGVDRTIYMSTRSYPDDELLALLAAASEATGTPEQELLEEFGEFLGPALLEMYRAQIDDAWDAIDLIDHTEDAIHEVVRLREPEADPPALETTRVDGSTVDVHYTSDRHLCGLAKGITAAVGDHFDQSLSVRESQCMLDGADSCELRITTA